MARNSAGEYNHGRSTITTDSLTVVLYIIIIIIIIVCNYCNVKSQQRYAIFVISSKRREINVNGNGRIPMGADMSCADGLHIARYTIILYYYYYDSIINHNALA